MGTDMELDIRLEPAVREVIREVSVNLTKVIEDKLGPASLLLQAQGKQLEDHETRIKEAEARMSVLEEITNPVLDKLQSLEKRVKELADRGNDLENRGKTKNICIIGVLGGAEGSDPISFFECWMPELNIKTKAGRLKVERAHRTAAQVRPLDREHVLC